jgi:hypothetical protein
MKLWLSSLFLLALAARSDASITITTTKLPAGTVGTAYSAAIDTSGGCTPDSWKIAHGSLPTGIIDKLNGGTMGLTGIPTIAATYSFQVEVTDCQKHISEKWYKIVIEAAGGHVVDLSWTASTSNDVVGYNVYRGPDGKTWSKINISLTASTYYDDSTVAGGKTYYYATTAVDVHGDESTKSAPVEAVIP